MREARVNDSPRRRSTMVVSPSTARARGPRGRRHRATRQPCMWVRTGTGAGSSTCTGPVRGPRGCSSRLAASHPRKLHDAGGCLRIRERVVMAERDRKLPAHADEVPGTTTENSAGQRPGTDPRQTRPAKPHRAKRGEQDASIEGRMVGREEPDPGQELDRLCPGPGEGRRAFHVGGRDAVQTREREMRRGRPHQPSARHPLPLSHYDHGERADAVRSLIGQLEVDRREWNIEGDATPHPVSLPRPTGSRQRSEPL